MWLASHPQQASTTLKLAMDHNFESKSMHVSDNLYFCFRLHFSFHLSLLVSAVCTSVVVTKMHMLWPPGALDTADWRKYM